MAEPCARTVLLIGRSKANCLRLPAERKRRLPFVTVSIGEEDILFLSPAERRSWRQCLRRAQSVVLHRISFEKCRKVSMTRYGSTSVLVTIILTRPGAGAVLLFLSNCIFKPTLNEQYYNNVIRLGSKSSSRSLPVGSTIFYREHEIECLICRTKSKLSEIKPLVLTESNTLEQTPDQERENNGEGKTAVASVTTCIVCMQPTTVLMHWTKCGVVKAHSASDSTPTAAPLTSAIKLPPAPPSDTCSSSASHHGCCRGCLLAYLESKGISQEDRKQFVDPKQVRAEEEEQWVRKHDWADW